MEELEKKNWETVLEQINKNVETERSLLKNKLKSKISELNELKENINNETKIALTVNKAREDRIHKLESELESKNREIAVMKTKHDGLAEENRISNLRLEQLEKENIDIKIELKRKVAQINQLKMELLPRYGLSRAGANLDKVDKIADSLKDTEDFYRSMSERIDRILRD